MLEPTPAIDHLSRCEAASAMSHPGAGRDNGPIMDDDDLDSTISSDPSVQAHLVEERRLDPAWQKLDLEGKLKHVMDLLSRKACRWDADGPSDLPPLDDYKREDLLTTRDNEISRATALHIMAIKYKSGNVEFPGEILRPVIRDLLKGAAHETGKETKEEPILKVAVAYDNDEFVEHLKAAAPVEFPRLLAAKDSEGKNALHHIFDPVKRTANSKREQSDARRALARAAQFINDADRETVAARDSEGNTPIHYAASYRQCRGRDETYVELFKTMVEKAEPFMKGDKAFNNKEESPIAYCKRTHKEAEDRNQRKREKEKQLATANAAKAASDSASVRETPVVRMGIDSPIDKSAMWKLDQSQLKAAKPDLGRESKTNGDAYIFVDKTVIKSGLQRRGTARMTVLADKAKIPDEDSLRRPTRSIQPEPVPTATGVNSKEGAVRSSVDKPKSSKRKAYELILDFLKLHYIRTRTDREARDLIHGKDASDQNLYFDASGHTQAQDIIDLIERLSIGGFSDTLAYVYIPALKHGDGGDSVQKPASKRYGVGREQIGEGTENPRMGRKDLVGVFDALSSHGVRRILRLDVEDMVGPSHTDAAIERAIRGQENVDILPVSKARTRKEPISVEAWNWQKPDLSSDVVEFAAPNVEQVTLYWSGNQTVLKGWASEKGIARLTKLHTLRLIATPGLESVARMNASVETFKKELAALTSDRVKVNVTVNLSGLMASRNSNKDEADSTSGPAGNQLSDTHRQHTWVRKMEDFRRALAAIHNEVLGKLSIQKQLKTNKIKVALIDDGLELRDLNTYGNIVEATGRSYYPRTGQIENPWHRSTHGHGTIMANTIARINPWASLHVMRVWSERTNAGTRTIYPGSAAGAIRCAIQADVQIISISWTVLPKKKTSPHEDDTNPPDPETAELRDLEAAIAEAVKHKILIFCSASDEIEEDATKTLPYKAAADYVFRIGAALPHGQGDLGIGDKKRINYYFPGVQVVEDVNPRLLGKGLPTYHDGSSVGTALAAGLASLIMYCVVVLRECKGAGAGAGSQQQQQQGQAWGLAGGGGVEHYNALLRALQQRHNMKRAFDNIGVEDKYLAVWREFGEAAEGIAKLGKPGTATEEVRDRERMRVLQGLVNALCHKVE